MPRIDKVSVQKYHCADQFQAFRLTGTDVVIGGSISVMNGRVDSAIDRATDTVTDRVLLVSHGRGGTLGKRA